MTISPRYDQYKDAWDTCELAGVKFSFLIPLFLCGSVAIFLLRIIILSHRFKLGTQSKQFVSFIATKEESIVSLLIILGSLRGYMFI